MPAVGVTIPFPIAFSFAMHLRSSWPFSIRHVAAAGFLLCSGAALAQAGANSANHPSLRSAANSPVASQRYTVQQGDTLWSIAGHSLKNHADWRALWRMNRALILNPHWIFPGQVLQLPIKNVTKCFATKRFATNGSTSYAIDRAGHVWAWGVGRDGVLGNGSTANSSTPVQVQFPSTLGAASIVSVSSNSGGYDGAGYPNTYTAYALDSAGHVWAWGVGDDGVLGNGSTANSSTPVQVQFPSSLGKASIVSVSSGGHNGSPAYALDSAGHVWAWGFGGDGGLGNGSTASSSTPVRVQFPSTLGAASIVSVSSGGNTAYALDSAGHVWAWGYGGDGGLGNGSTASSSTPVRVQFPSTLGAASIVNVSVSSGSSSEGFSHAYAIDSVGHLWAWGDNQVGELGDGSTMHHSTPVRVQFPSTLRAASIISVSSGGYTAYALDSAGHVWAWGLDRDGVLGNGPMADMGNGSIAHSSTPVRVRFPSALGTASIVGVSSGGNTAYVIDSAGHVWAWGNGRDGVLGNGSTANSSTPVQVQFPSSLGKASIVSVSSGDYDGYPTHADAIDSAGHVWAWGDNQVGGLGNGSTASSSTPVRVQLLVGITP